MAVYDNKGIIVAASAELPQTVINQPHTVSDAMDRNESMGDFLKIDGKSMYVFVEPLHQNDTVVGAFMIVQNAGYIDSSINQIWGSNLFRLLIQIFFFSVIVIWLVRWIIFKPLKSLAESVKSARTGRGENTLEPLKRHS